jgi:hypothetical protein
MLSFAPSLVALIATAMHGCLGDANRAHFRRITTLAFYVTGLAVFAAAVCAIASGDENIERYILSFAATLRIWTGSIWRLPFTASWFPGSLLPITATHAFYDQFFPVGLMMYGAAWAVGITPLVSPKWAPSQLHRVFAATTLACTVLCTPRATCLHPFIGLLLLLRVPNVAPPPAAATAQPRRSLAASRRAALGIALGPATLLVSLHFVAVFDHAWAVLRSSQQNMAYYGLILVALTAFNSIEWIVRDMHSTSMAVDETDGGGGVATP